MTSFGNVNSWSPFCRRLSKQNMKSIILWFSRKREQQSMNHFNLHAASTKVSNFHVHTNELCKQVKGKREVANLAAVFVDVRILDA